MFGSQKERGLKEQDDCTTTKAAEEEAEGSGVHTKEKMCCQILVVQ